MPTSDEDKPRHCCDEATTEVRKVSVQAPTPSHITAWKLLRKSQVPADGVLLPANIWEPRSSFSD